MNRQQALEALGVSDSTLPDEIQQQFQELMEKYSPENASPSLRSEYAEKQRKLAGAYNVLTTPAQDARSSAQPSDPNPSTARVVSEKTDSDSPSYTQTAPSPRVTANLDAILNMVPEATRNELLQNAEGIQAWVRQQIAPKLPKPRERNSAKLSRIRHEIDARLRRSTGTKPSSLRSQIIDDISCDVYDVLVPDALGRKRTFFGYLRFALLSIFYMPSLQTIGWLESVTYNKVRQCVYGNLNTAKSTNDLQRIQELVSYSLLFIQDFGLDGEIEQVTSSESFSTGGHSISSKTGTINPRIIARLSRMVTHAHKALARPNLSDYERDKIMDEFHLNLEQATETDFSQWTYQIVMGEALRWVKQQHRVVVLKRILRIIAFPIVLFVTFYIILGIALSVFLVGYYGYQIVAHIAIPVLVVAAIVAYIKRDLLREKITQRLGRRKVQLPQANPVQNNESNADNQL